MAIILNRKTYRSATPYHAAADGGCDVESDTVHVGGQLDDHTRQLVIAVGQELKKVNCGFDWNTDKESIE